MGFALQWRGADTTACGEGTRRAIWGPGLSLTPTGLNLNIGAGNTTVDFTSDYGQGVDASIEGGVGEATVILPPLATAMVLVARKTIGNLFLGYRRLSYAPEGFDTHAEVLKDDGRGALPLSAAGEGSERHNVMGIPTQDNLERLGRMLEAGTLRVPIQSTHSLDQAGEALRALSTAHTQGKHAIRVA